MPDHNQTRISGELTVCGTLVNGLPCFRDPHHEWPCLAVTEFTDGQDREWVGDPKLARYRHQDPSGAVTLADLGDIPRPWGAPTSTRPTDDVDALRARLVSLRDVPGDALHIIGDTSGPRCVPRVFLDGETVPAGVCVLTGDGDVHYLDGTAGCRCHGREPTGRCTECSYDSVNGNFGPLVEVVLPDYHLAVRVDRDQRRSRSVALSAHLPEVTR